MVVSFAGKLISGVPLVGAPIFCLILSLLIQKDGGTGPDDVLATNQPRGMVPISSRQPAG